MKRVMALLGLIVAAPVQAEVKAADANGLIVRQLVHIAATPERVYAALLTPGRWWDSAHSWSGDAANITLDPVAGGCFCEAIPAARGAAEHGRVVNIVPNRLIRLRAELGPFQAMGVAGALSWELAPADGGTMFSQTYVVGGFMPGGFQPMAAAVDGVMGGQASRLKAFVERK